MTAPDTTDVAISRHTPTIQIHSLAVDLTSTVLSTVSENATADHTASAAPQASLSVSQELKSAVTYATVTAALIALTPVWYATFPVTIPVSLAVAGYVVAALSILSGGLKQSYIPLALGLGLGGWAVGPLYLVDQAAKTTGRYIKSLVDPAPTQTTASSSASQTLREARQTKRGQAGSRRNANSNRTPSAHRAAKDTTPPTNGKRTGTAGTGRSVSKGGHE
ncbi:hypothetical protein [Mycolicibacterium pallens]|uniref:Transmembrane protein n=1 Tax=Mycolicibacterium pallens TaxID=370524 RepID=A0ABX8VLB5_9MYCO|nr:hypothetical protein [Mycolicibacterium pallens]QYL17838.1 hypothetical protein K0O64_04590 [Mycolicibacterium pallens]